MPKSHCLTPYIEILKEKANNYNYKAICLACIEFKRKVYTLEEKFTNTKKCCCDHFKKCFWFKQKYEEQATKIIDNTDSENTMQRRYKRSRIIYNEDNESDSFDEFNSLSNNTSNSTSKKLKDKLFRFINSAIKLPPRRTLSRIILSNTSNHLVNKIQQKAQNNIY
ncbi:13491_t:CDS:2, partial [Racocetra persica]